MTVGSSQALFTALLGILNPGEEVIVPVPAFSLYETIITIAGGKTVPLDVSETGFQIDEGALERLITPNTKAVILNSPNNPTGVILNEKSLAAVKRAVLGKPIFLVCDNVYNQLADAPCPDLSLDGELREQMLLCQSFSKPYAMTGWRLGYLVCPEYVMERLLLLSAGMIGRRAYIHPGSGHHGAGGGRERHAGNLPAAAGLRHRTAQEHGAGFPHAPGGVLCVCGHPQIPNDLGGILHPADSGGTSGGSSRQLLRSGGIHPPVLLL